jgi:hypothetical protein
MTLSQLLEVGDLMSQVELKVHWGNKEKQYSLNLFEPKYLNWLEINSSNEIKKIEISTHFPPKMYSQTDRCVMPSEYQCLGSGSAIFYCGDNQVAYICLVGFYDTKVTPSHNNFWLWGRTKNGKYVNDNNIIGHVIPNSDDVSIKIILNNREETAFIKRKQI